MRVDGSYDATLSELIASLAASKGAAGELRIGFEAAHLTVSRHSWIVGAVSRQTAAVTFVPTEGIVEQARVRKDDFEIATLRAAAQRLSRVAEQVVGDLRAGQTEVEVAIAIEQRLRFAGFARPAFDTIVAAGPNAALPHARPGERKLTEGDLVVLDFGGVYDSYCVDLTRTVSVGRAVSRARSVYDAVLEAHDRAIDAVAPGRSPFDIDAAARDTLGRHGLAEVFGHGTGHGLGIEVHEGPRITRRKETEADSPVEAGMVFTIEPGAYVPGFGGVRIEDDVLVTADGAELLTDVRSDLVER
jgi:Xaa-Pro aminopeptidase